MSSDTAADHHRQSESAWTKRLMPYRKPSTGRIVFEILVSVGPFVGLWIATWLLVANGI
jgi:acyl-lipid omega-6 desaturase (Delta-12 desaturase)